GMVHFLAVAVAGLAAADGWPAHKLAAATAAATMANARGFIGEPPVKYYSLFFGTAGTFGTRCGATHEQALPVLREREICADAAIRSVLSLIAFDDDFRARGQRVLGEPHPEQGVGTTALDHPACDFAVRSGHIQMNPRVRIDHFPFGDHAP